MENVSQTTAVRPARRVRAARAWRRNRLPYLLLAPALLFMLVVHFGPTGAGVYTAFLRINVFTFNQLFDAPAAGFDNFRAILFESSTIRSGLVDATRNTLYYTAWTLGLTLVAAMGIALLLNREFTGRRLVRTLMLAPWVVPSFVVAILWQLMWQSDSGIINKVLVDYLHVLDEKPVWLLGPHSMWAIIIPSVWRGLPFVMLVFLAGLQAIPRELYEAAATDGASAWRRFWTITLPLMRPLIAIQLLLGFVYGVYQFALPYVMLGTNPGPYADLLLTMIVRQTFTNTLFGYGAAISVLLMAAMFVVVLIWYRGFKRDLEGATI
jgi:multiple sugar transport system permease protein